MVVLPSDSSPSYHDNRSISMSAKRVRTEAEKYCHFRDVNRGQVGQRDSAATQATRKSVYKEANRFSDFLGRPRGKYHPRRGPWAKNAKWMRAPVEKEWTGTPQERAQVAREHEDPYQRRYPCSLYEADTVCEKIMEPWFSELQGSSNLHSLEMHAESHLAVLVDAAAAKRERQVERAVALEGWELFSDVSSIAEEIVSVVSTEIESESEFELV
ncbi:hypothetical protein BJ546DRAFT_724590 [Cryomyces antarcticus]|nr:hypothetical protein LTR60_002064 [Cryomyces antarcticus]KAK5156081.1 hypothetical protein LTR04_005698 [Oleoguttula sp. CCFEE 6159]